VTRYLALLLLVLPVAAKATVLSGPIVHLAQYQYPTGTVEVDWTGYNDTGAWFYGSVFHSATTTADVYNAGVLNPLTVEDASVFPYSTDYALVHEGETVFIRGQNGYAAWVIEDVGPLYTYPEPWTPYIEQGTWYYQNDGSGNFSSAVPEPSSALLFSMSLALCAWMVRIRLV